MIRLLEALSWSGSDATLILFTVWSSDSGGPVSVHGSGTVPLAGKPYRLEDPERRLGSREVYEYDLVFDSVPHDIERVVTSWLAAVIDAGAEVGWFAFEGSFDFGHLLTDDVARQVFAVADRRALSLALDDERREGREWTEELEVVRDRLQP